MPKFRTILELTINADTQDEANEVGEGAALHLLETFNDDESIESGVRFLSGAPVNVIVPASILQRCESFISGFEDDDAQKGVRALLADIRKAIDGNPAPAARPFDEQELATVLAALRCYQQVRSQCGGDIPEDLQDIADNGGTLEALETDEIDGLCERLNLGEVGTVAPATHSDEDSTERAERLRQGAKFSLATVGPFYVMLDHDQSADECATIEAARESGRAILEREPLACKLSIQDANGEHVEDIGSKDAAGVVALATHSDTSGTSRRVFEVTGAGFDGTGDTDNLVFWIRADSEEQVMAAIKDTDAKFCQELPEGHGIDEGAIDFTLPREAISLGAALLECVGVVRNKNRHG